MSTLLRSVLTTLALVTLSAVALPPPAFAEGPASPPVASSPAAATDPQARLAAAAQAAQAALQKGPRDIALAGQGVLKLPEGFGFIPAGPAGEFLKAQGSRVGPDFQGLVVGDAIDGFVVVRFEDAGYVKDEEAREWDAAKLLDNLKSGTEAANEDRRKLGMPEFSVQGWVEAPRYDEANHRLVWSASTREKNGAASDGDGVNYNTYVLGREGYFSMNLVTSLATVEQQKPVAQQLLAALSFDEGKRYADFNSSTDKVAEYGLAALVGGIAAKKLGLLATLGVFLAKFWKVAALAVVGAGAGLRKLFGRKDGQA
ncbi:MAG TPA: DUF2167 domain-containing protein [Zoogloea sp.]|uniref:DUF2167 domain-containing protein n=2 Tax=Zoogloea sp. TaxID=49181 RepID=UPI002C336617|nr:DUF2167 domain-containing protein [Zoogloea sp.]HNI49450.1 DUF2167 domain-containing protein [Zoogloea sp.]